VKKLDGEVMVFLREMQSQAPEFFYHCAAEKLGLQNLRDLMLFCKALAELK